VDLGRSPTDQKGGITQRLRLSLSRPRFVRFLSGAASAARQRPRHGPPGAARRKPPVPLAKPRSRPTLPESSTE
jgi:hypothetical protein